MLLSKFEFIMAAPAQLVSSMYALGAVGSWGISDFVGGYTARRFHSFFLAAIGHLSGTTLVVSLALAVVSFVLVEPVVGKFSLALVCLFGVYASSQFLRGRSFKLLLIALCLGGAVDIVALIALPIYSFRIIGEMASLTDRGVSAGWGDCEGAASLNAFSSAFDTLAESCA